MKTTTRTTAALLALASLTLTMAPAATADAPISFGCTEVVNPVPGGVVGDTAQYAVDMTNLASCTTAAEGNNAMDGVYTTAAFVSEYIPEKIPCCISFPGPPLGGASEVLAPVAGTIGSEIVLACYYAAGNPYCSAIDPAPGAVMGTCPVQLPPSGGIVGATTAYGNTACGMAVGGTTAAAGEGIEFAGDLAQWADDRIPDSITIAPIVTPILEYEQQMQAIALNAVVIGANAAAAGCELTLGYALGESCNQPL